MEQLLAHLLGDYVLQNHWMANRKTTSSMAALVHVLLYGLPFLLLTTAWWQWVVIVGTHYVIDRYRLAAYWVDFWGTGKAGWFPSWFGQTFRGRSVSSDCWDEKGTYIPLTERVPDAPAWLGVWLLIIVDNTMHLCINFAVLKAA